MNDANYRTFQRYEGKKLLKQGHGVILPAGVVIDGRPWRGFKHSVQVETYVMNKPEELITDPDPRCEYCWRPREDPKHSTEGLVRTGRLIPVTFERVDPASDLAPFVYEYAGAGKDNEVIGMVACGNMGLFEVPPKETYQWYQHPVDATFAALQGLKAGFEERVEEFTQRNPGMEHLGSDIKYENQKTVDQEKRSPDKGGAPIVAGK